ncbi:MAG: LysR family transcriptional regulator [Methyloligellaceae bacterium]
MLLKTFMAVVRSGSFSGAAEELNSVQSNITSRIKRLEEHFGQPAFERGRGGARLNAFGERLKIHAEDLLLRFELAERELMDAAGAHAPLRIGSMETTAAVRLPGILKMLKQASPMLPISLRTGPTADMISLLWDRKIDAAFVAGPVDQSRFESVPAFVEQLMVARPQSGGEANALLAFRTGCSYRSVAESWLRDQGKSDTEILEMGTLEGILGCVDVGMGFAVAPKLAIGSYRGVENLTLSPLPEPFGSTETLLAWRNDSQITKGLEKLIETVSLLTNEA